ncbi:membrane fusion protein (multidrug efflux system)/multidrug efflux system membrane fusion protein [Roseiarcus fermentans]|uniref:Membrane fusion protein (Multidrug efflux system)/multidrug efflux system membrane fusion protein n=1 Tax=Roseiarcus fermentans TaxID=1473586 RepID=A0A366EWW4_9HYPH|nr:efflux RND transporter periplasmic adaptor subunit [Roseiarcus fermentans]RBP06406.1 membrane fusion protein (multidrug efflux system)/multidrug efflux system membrane fusion protein [Roseiarcus fermentans]
MKAIDWILATLALAALAAGALGQAGVVHPPAPPIAFVVAAAVLVALLVIRWLPLRVRRPVVFIVTLCALAGLTVGLAWFQFVIKPAMLKGIMAAAFAPKPTTVSVSPATMEQWPPALTAIGTLRAYQGIFIAPQVAGVITAIHFESGQDVKEGDLLINLDDSVEQADLAAGQAQLRNAEATLARQKTLVLGGNTPQATLDSALAARDSAAASVQRTQAVIAQKAIRAPFPGRIGIRNGDVGQFAAVGTPLASLTRLEPIYADFPVTEDALATIAVGQDTAMTVAPFPGQTFQGRIKAVDARVNADSRNITIRAEFANPDRRLLPGMFANLTVTTGAPREVLTLPRTAIVYSLYGNNVFVVAPAPPPPAPSGTASAAAPAAPGGLVVERRFVRLGAVRGERIAITDGVKEGERVVDAGQIKLQPHMPVVIDDRPALPPPAQTPLQ